MIAVLIGTNSFIVSAQEKKIRVVELDIIGAHRTNLSWLKHFLQLTVPKNYSTRELLQLKTKLLSTRLFYQVVIKTIKKDAVNYVLKIILFEKWTLIPVVRVAYGGNLTKKVLGAYDTHVFGKGIVLGGELHQYGSDNLGYVLYGVLPKRFTQSYHFESQFWQFVRRYPIYNATEKQVSALSFRQKRIRLRVFYPVGQISSKWQAGIDLWQLKDHTLSLDSSNSLIDTSMSGIDVTYKRQAYYRLLSVLLYDDIAINGLLKAGRRLIFYAGREYSHFQQGWRFSLESFSYHKITDTSSLAWHFFSAYSDLKRLGSLFILGGLDSLRGALDAQMIGNRAYYSNVELRSILYSWQYLRLQHVAFVDVGAAKMNYFASPKEVIHSVGMGVRLIVPQVNRLMLRFDVAYRSSRQWSIGLSAGMNHFFQPYRPLQVR